MLSALSIVLMKTVLLMGCRSSLPCRKLGAAQCSGVGMVDRQRCSWVARVESAGRSARRKKALDDVKLGSQIPDGWVYICVKETARYAGGWRWLRSLHAGGQLADFGLRLGSLRSLIR